MRRRESLIAVTCLLVLAGGCGRAHTLQPVKQATVTVLYCCGSWSPLSPEEDEQAKFLAFLPLVARNANGELEARLAQSWEHSPDYRSWTIHLRKGVHWQDGVPVTARDIKFTLDLMSNPLSCNFSIESNAVTVKILDDYTYTLTYRHRAAGSPLDDWTVYYPKHLLAGLDPKNCASWNFWRYPVGDGPYRHVRTVPQTMMEFEADPAYYRGKPKIEHVVLKFFPGGDLNGPPPLTELLSGNVDVIPEAAPLDVMKLSDDRRFRTYFYFWTFPYFEGAAVLWNERDPLFHDSMVRRALTLAINRHELHRVLNLPEEAPVFDVLFTPQQFRRGEPPAPLPYDPEQAKRLLDQAGWHIGRKNGLRERGGRPFRFTAVTSDFQGLYQAAIYIQAELRHVGVQMDIQNVVWDVLRDRFVKTGNFQAAITLFPFEGEDALFFGEKSVMGYRNTKAIALLKKAEDTMDPDEYDRVYRELWPIFQADIPATFLFHASYATVADRHIQGLSTPWHADPVQYMKDLWLDDGGGK